VIALHFPSSKSSNLTSPTLVLHKPEKFVCLKRNASEKNSGEIKDFKSIYDIVPGYLVGRRPSVSVGGSPIGRDVSGLILLSENKELLRNSMKKSVEKEYQVVLEKPVSESDISAIREG